MKFINNVSARDRNLLVLLVVAITFYLCYTFVMAPGMEKSSLLRGEITAAKTELESANRLAESTKDLKKQENNLRKQLLDKYAVFFTDLDQANILYKMDTLMLGAGLKVNSYIPSAVAVAPVGLEQGGYTPLDYPMRNLSKTIEPKLQEEAVSEQPAIASGEEGDTPDKIPCMEIVINFDGSSYESVYNFIYSLEQMKKTVIVRNMDYATADGGLQGQLILDFYSAPRFDLAQKDSLEFVTVIPQGKANPIN